MATGGTQSSTGHISNKVCDACAFENKNEKGVSFCVECAEYLCTNCTRDHKKNRASRKHKLLEENEAPDKPEIFKLMKHMLECPEHAENDVTLKCVEHNTFVCTVCVAVNHRQCHDVVEVSKDTLAECAAEEIKARLINTLENVNTSVSAFQTAKLANIESLRLDAANIQEERQTYLHALYKHLEELCVLSEQETESKIKKEIEGFERDISTAKELNVEDNLQLLKLVASHGNVQQQNIICEKISMEATLLDKESKSLRHKENISLKFQKNEAFEKVTFLGTVDLFRDPVSSSSDGDHFGVSVSSDALEEEDCSGHSITAQKIGDDKISSSYPTVSNEGSGHSVGAQNIGADKISSSYPAVSTEVTECSGYSVSALPQKTGADKMSSSYPAISTEVTECSGYSVSAQKIGADKIYSSPPKEPTKMKTKAPFLQSNLSEDIVSYNIYCSDTWTSYLACSVSAIVLLSDGHFVLADKVHKMIKFLDKNFSVLSSWKVPHEPIDLCEPVNGCLAVIYDGVKEIGRFSFNNIEKTFSVIGKFQTKLFPISISKSDDGIAVLFSDEMRDTPKSSDDDTIEIQTRHWHNSEIIERIDRFEGCDTDEDLELTDTDRILVLDTDPELFIVTESSEIHCFDINEMDDDSFCEVWYYKSHKNNVLEGASDVDADDEGNVYVCGKTSRNVHQVSSQNFRHNRVLFSVQSPPTALCVDSEKRQIIVGCEGDSCIYVASFD